MTKTVGYRIWIEALVERTAEAIIAGADEYESVEMSEILERIRLACIQRVRAREKNVITHAAAKLGMNRSTMRYQLKIAGGR